LFLTDVTEAFFDRDHEYVLVNAGVAVFVTVRSAPTQIETEACDEREVEVSGVVADAVFGNWVQVPVGTEV